MSYIAQLIKNECPECQPERVSVILAKNGISNPTKEYHYDIYTYYIERLDFHKEESQPYVQAKRDARKKYKISRWTIDRIVQEF